MPELPEVEIVRKSLAKKIKQKKVKKVIIRNRNLRFKIPLNFTNFLINQKIIEVKRFSKYLILGLSNNSYCLLHLGMSGTIHIEYFSKKNIITNSSFYSSPILPKKHNHVEIVFENLKIIYNDPRRFGFFQVIKKLINFPIRFKSNIIDLNTSSFFNYFLFLHTMPSIRSTSKHVSIVIFVRNSFNFF